ncbi:hypothetical protein ACF0H5_021087 [Mactra antiquata]
MPGIIHILRHYELMERDRNRTSIKAYDRNISVNDVKTAKHLNQKSQSAEGLFKKANHQRYQWVVGTTCEARQEKTESHFQNDMTTLCLYKTIRMIHK